MTQADQLKQVIRKIIKEEVANEVSKAMSKILVEMVKEIKRPPTSVIRESEEPESEQETNMPVLRTNNPKLNGVLAETARHFKPLQKVGDGESLVELMEGGFEKIGKHETVTPGQPATKLDFLKQMVNESVTPMPSALDADAPIPDALKKVFKQDFRAILQKSKERGGGLFNPAMLFSGQGEAPTPD